LWFGKKDSCIGLVSKEEKLCKDWLKIEKGKKRMIKKIFELSLIVLLLISGISYAIAEEKRPKAGKRMHSPIIGRGAGVISKGHLRIRMNYFYMDKDRYVKGSSATLNPANKRVTIHKELLRFYYGLFSDFHVVVTIPYLSKKQEMEMSGKKVKKHTSGLGDIKLIGKIRILRQSPPQGHGLSMALAGGMKLPTGKDDAKREGVLIPPPLQPGSGSTDYILAIFGTKKFSRFFLHSNIMYQICTKGSQEYKFGNILTYNLALVYPVASYIDIVGELNGSYKAKDEQYGTKLVNTGGYELYFSPGIKCNLSSSVVFELSIPLCIWRELNGIQNASDYKIAVGILYEF